MDHLREEHRENISITLTLIGRNSQIKSFISQLNLVGDSSWGVVMAAVTACMTAGELSGRRMADANLANLVTEVLARFTS